MGVNANIFEATISLIEDVYSFFERTKDGEKYLSPLASLKEESSTPCVLAVAGKVKAGKSCFINSLLGVDLAMTGTTETTATINVFKNGIPPSKDKPILCHWLDGSKEWKPKSFLDKLQGTDPSVLALTSKIERLVFYIEGHPLLEEVTLVDTPGIGADVGENGDSHQIQTDVYFNLRKRHQSETINISSRADAVIYLFNTVPTETDQRFITELYDNGKGLTALNGMGVLSKIDKDISVVNNIPKYNKLFEKELFKIIPASPTVSKCLPNKQLAIEVSSKIKAGFQSRKGFNLAMGSERAFLHENLPDCTLNVSERKRIIEQLTGNNVPWETFKLIIMELYSSENITESLDRLNNLSGLVSARELIDEHFFKRSRLLRCNRLLSDLLKIISEYKYSDQYLYLEQYASSKQYLMAQCEQIQKPYQDILINLVRDHIPNTDEVCLIREQIESFVYRAEDALRDLKDVNDLYLAFQKVIQKRNEFSTSEFDELSILFTGKSPELNSLERYKYWTSAMIAAAPNSVRQYVAKIAKSRYSKLAGCYVKN